MNKSLQTAPRRVLYVDHTAVLAGGEIALLNLVRYLDRTRFEPTVCLLSDGPLAEELAKSNIPVHILPTSRRLLEARKDSIGMATFRGGPIAAALKSVGQIKRIIEQTKPDLVHANSLKSDILGGLAARLARRPAIWHIRDRIETDYLSPTATHLVRTLANVLPNHVIANSQATLKTVHLHDPRAGSVVYSGLDLAPFLAISREGMRQPPRIGMVGRLTHWKGQHVFLQAAALVHEYFPAARFQLVGGPLFSETDYETSLHRLAESLGIAEVTEFTGHRTDVAQQMAGMDVVVHASVTAEPFGQVVVLAMAAGKPVIATSGGGVPEIVSQGRTGLLVPMNDAAALAGAIERLLTQPDFAEALGRAGRRRARNYFTIQRTAAQMMDVYDQVLATR